jgi:manganese/zinc/iron transport system permease protein
MGMDFFTFSDPNVRMVAFGAMLLGMSAATVGCFTFLRKRALVGDAIAHAVLPGVCLAFMVTGEKHPGWLLLGAVIAGWVSLLVMDFMANHSKLKTDTAIGAVLSVFFGLGILLLTAIQHSGSGNQSGLDQFLFGKAASMGQRDVWVFGGVALMLLLIVVVFFQAFKLVAFDRDFARATGLPVRRLEFLLSTVTVLSVATGIQAVGVVLMAALLITPAAAARFWTDNMVKMVLLAAVFGLLSGLFGAWVSYTAPAMPTGPWIVMLLSVIAVVSVLAAPERGIWARVRLQRANRRKMLRENTLKVLFLLATEAGEAAERSAFFSREAIVDRRPFEGKALEKGLRRLSNEGLVESSPQGYRLSAKGWEEGMRVVRLHRLWELYLTERMNLAADHVHNTAEAIEHLLTPEVEEALLRELGRPVLDPHESVIPYG